MKTRFSPLLFFWFLLLGHSPIVVGPFLHIETCNAIREEVRDNGIKVTSCWADAPLRRDHQ